MFAPPPPAPGINMAALLVFRKLDWEEMNLKVKVEVWAPSLTHNT